MNKCQLIDFNKNTIWLSLTSFLSPQDKSVAFKIFELGLKKYGDIPEYILAYIDYLSHLNGNICAKKKNQIFVLLVINENFLILKL